MNESVAPALASIAPRLAGLIFVALSRTALMVGRVVSRGAGSGGGGGGSGGGGLSVFSMKVAKPGTQVKKAGALSWQGRSPNACCGPNEVRPHSAGWRVARSKITSGPPLSP